MKDALVKSEIIEIGLEDERYPASLREITDPPRQLYVRGDVSLLQTTAGIAVVGTRRPSAYGLAVVDKLIGAAANHAVIVSGLAYGIDAAAHLAALKSGGPTIAVVGSGIDDEVLYPAGNRRLAQQIIASGGVIVSEYPAGTRAQKYYFPMRNRIIAGLSTKVIVIEAGEKSGSLITANLGLEYNREVLAVPGSIFNVMSKGPNWLIAQGAKPLLRLEDIIEGEPTLPLGRLRLEGEEQIIYDILGAGPIAISPLSQMAKFDIAKTSGILTVLELKGAVVSTAPGVFARK